MESSDESERLVEISNNNPDYDKFTKFVDERDLTYAPITKVDVERCFSVLKRILTELRKNLKDENLAALLNVQLNKHLL